MNSYEFLVLGLEEFGPSKLNNLQDILPHIRSQYLNSREDISKEVLELYKNVYKYIGSQIKPYLKDLPREMQLEMKKFKQSWGKHFLKRKK